MKTPGEIGFITVSMLLLFLVLFILYIITLQNTLKVISPENRKMQPQGVWLMLVPVIGVIWQFVVVGRMADSIRDECSQLNIPVSESRPGFTIGAVYCFSYLVCLIPEFATFGSFVVLISWIMYWREVNKYKKLLLEHRKQQQLNG